MTKRLPATPAPGPLEDYVVRFDDLFGTLAQRQAFRRYLEGLLLPAERNKTLTALANTEPAVGTQRRANFQSIRLGCSTKSSVRELTAVCASIDPLSCRVDWELPRSSWIIASGSGDQLLRTPLSQPAAREGWEWP